MKKDKFTSIKQIPKEAIEMIDDVRWWYYSKYTSDYITILPERLSSSHIVDLCNSISSEGLCSTLINGTDNFRDGYYYIEPRELEDKTYGINLYKKIHGIK